MGNNLKTIGFILIFIGTSGLLLNEFVDSCGRAGTIVFACFNVIGLLILIIGKKK
jgi:hypothetical protein